MTEFNLGKKKAQIYVNSLQDKSGDEDSSDINKPKRESLAEELHRKKLEVEKYENERKNKLITTQENAILKKKSDRIIDYVKTAVYLVAIIIMFMYARDFGEFAQKTFDKYIYPNDERIYENKQEAIYFHEFKEMVIGKSKAEIKRLFGNPDEAQDLMGMKLWYYRQSSGKIKIINEDTEKEINMVQIQFNGDTASSVNLY